MCTDIKVLTQSSAADFGSRYTRAREATLTSGVHWQDFYVVRQNSQDGCRDVYRKYKGGSFGEGGMLAYRVRRIILLKRRGRTSGRHLDKAHFHRIIVSCVPLDTLRIGDPAGSGRDFDGVSRTRRRAQYQLL